jgi:hypothetical protein
VLLGGSCEVTNVLILIFRPWRHHKEIILNILRSLLPTRSSKFHL